MSDRCAPVDADRNVAAAKRFPLSHFLEDSAHESFHIHAVSYSVWQ